MSGDRTLFYFSQNAPQFVADIVDVGFDDLPELARKIQGLRAEIDQVESKAQAIADEQAERMAEPPDAGWIETFNARSAS